MEMCKDKTKWKMEALREAEEEGQHISYDGKQERKDKTARAKAKLVKNSHDLS